MIRVLYMSDLHLEMRRRRSLVDFCRGRTGVPSGPALKDVPLPDLIVLAGDIHSGLLSVAHADSLAKRFGVPVVLVAGNHEYYFQNLPEARQLMAKAAAATQGRVRFLDDEIFTLELQGERLHVLGSTLWTDFNLNHDVPLANAHALERMNDYRLINDGPRRLSPKRTMDRHFATRAWLHTSLDRLMTDDPATPRMIVTHHAPGAAFLGTRNGAIGPAYASDLLPEFEPYAPAFWIHGHTHYRHETFTRGFWVLSAPHGYKHEQEAEEAPYRPGILEI